MTEAEVLAVISRIEYRRHNCRIFSRRSVFNVGIELQIVFTVPHRETGVLGPLTTTRYFSYEMLERMTERDLTEFILRGIKDLELHEVDECLYLDGARIFDPHQEVGRDYRTYQFDAMHLITYYCLCYA